MRGGSRKSGGEETGAEGPDPGWEAEQAAPSPPGDFEILWKELQAVRKMRARQEREMEDLRRLALDMQEQVRLGALLQEAHVLSGARALEQVERLEARFSQGGSPGLAAPTPAAPARPEPAAIPWLEAPPGVPAARLDLPARSERPSRAGRATPAEPAPSLEPPPTSAPRVEPELMARVDEAARGVQALSAELEAHRRSYQEAMDAVASGFASLEARIGRLAVESSPVVAGELKGLREQVLPSHAGRLEALERAAGLLYSRLEVLEELPVRLQVLEELPVRLQVLEDLPVRLEALEELPARLEALGTPAARSEAPPEGLEGLGDLQARVDSLVERLGTLERARKTTAAEKGLLARVEALEARLEASGSLEPPGEPVGRSSPEDLQQALDSLDLSGITQPLEERLRALSEDLDRLRRKGMDPRIRERLDALEAQGLAGRLDRLEKEMGRHAERLDEELGAVFEQNRLRVAEMTDALDIRMAQVEEAAERVRELEEATIRSRAETGRVLQAAFERLEVLTGRLGRLDTVPTRLEALEEGVARVLDLEERLGGPEGPAHLREELDTLRAQLSPEAWEERLAPLEQRLSLRPEETQALFDSLDLSGVTQPLEHRLEVLTEEFDRVRRKGVDPRLRERLSALEALGLGGRLDRLEKELGRHAERLDEELEAVFEQNRLRVAEMTGAFDERMAMLEAAADRVHQLEDLTGRGRAETGQVLQTAFDRLEVLAGRLGRMEQHVLGPPGSQATVPPPGLTPGLEGRVRNLEGVEKKVRDLEVRVVEQSLEALTESRLLREEFERMSGHLATMTENLNQHFAMIWERIGGAGAGS